MISNFIWRNIIPLFFSFFIWQSGMQGSKYFYKDCLHWLVIYCHYKYEVSSCRWYVCKLHRKNTWMFLFSCKIIYLFIYLFTEGCCFLLHVGMQSMGLILLTLSTLNQCIAIAWMERKKLASDYFQNDHFTSSFVQMGFISFFTRVFQTHVPVLAMFIIK
jgi:hypothetical protein